MAFDLEKFRTRWFRWLGQKARPDRDGWVTLLESCWAGWANTILRRADQVSYPVLGLMSTRSDVYYCFRDAIAEATEEELKALDILYCDDLIEKMEWE